MNFMFQKMATMSFVKQGKIKMEAKKESTKKLPIPVIAAIVVVLAVVGIVALAMPKEESYRQIQVYSLDGTATVERASVGTMEAYANMMLQSEDRISVPEDSSMQLKLDEDKYVLLEPGTEIRLEATGNSTDSKTTIHLEKGAVISNLENKLSSDSGYEVSTPSSTMAVRGTTFRVEVTEDEDGNSYTLMSAFSGTVASCLTGETEELLVEAGFEIIAREAGDECEYVVTKQEVSYEDLKKVALDFLNYLLEKGGELSISKEEIEELIANLEKVEVVTYTVSFTYNGAVFATQIVTGGECAAKPLLMPTADGYWDFDFSKVVGEDITIEWIETE